ncbi:hypothetical protein ALC53_02056 [Atta colombica]|uniref:Uncharacterized protein n=1 Tax=Atta colombica TaxID=520822 RepID=A0A195BTJ1_9HYME|nr:hypothetical protein ALC53_02056 [Atta colombica]
MRSQKLEHSNADLLLISTEKLTIRGYCLCLALSFMRKQACGDYLSIDEDAAKYSWTMSNECAYRRTVVSPEDNDRVGVSGIKIVNHIKRGLKVGQQQITCEFNGSSPSLLKGSIIREGMATLPFLAKCTRVRKIWRSHFLCKLTGITVAGNGERHGIFIVKKLLRNWSPGTGIVKPVSKSA